MEKQFVDLLTEELKLQGAVADEHSRHMNVTLAEAKRVASQYQKEAEKCNAATEICDLMSYNFLLRVRKSIRTHVGDLDVAAVPCGFGRAIGNKGGVGLRIRVYDRIMCFVNCHLAAHLEAVTRRNADFNHIYRSMVFSKGQSVYTAASGIVPYLFLSCSLGFSTYLFWLLYSSGFPWALSLAAGASTSAQALKNNSGLDCFVKVLENVHSIF